MGDVTQKEGSGRPRLVWTEENIKQVGDILCSQSDEWGTPTEIANELEIDRWTVKRIMCFFLSHLS